LFVRWFVCFFVVVVVLFAMLKKREVRSEDRDSVRVEINKARIRKVLGANSSVKDLDVDGPQHIHEVNEI